MKAQVIVASTRAAAGEYSDRSGPILVQGLQAFGFDVAAAIVVPDGPQVGQALAAAVAEDVDVVITSGGTGLAPSDRTPEMTAELLTVTLPGIAEALRAAGRDAGVSTAALSRGVAGVAGSTIIVNVAGSRGAAVEAVEVLGGVLVHAVDQLRGSDH